MRKARIKKIVEIEDDGKMIIKEERSNTLCFYLSSPVLRK